MDEAGGLDDVIVDRGWRYTWLGNDPYVFDERTEYLARISPVVLGGLGTGTPAGGLSEVLRNLAETAVEGGEAAMAEADGDGVTVRLRLLGVRVNVRCAYQECADEIAAFYSASRVPEQASGPEVIVWCQTREAGRYLFRSRPDDQAGTPLEGVSVQTLRSPRQPWTSSLPPIPALASWPFKDRFAALHAAAVRLAGGSPAGGTSGGNQVRDMMPSHLTGAKKVRVVRRAESRGTRVPSRSGGTVTELTP